MTTSLLNNSQSPRRRRSRGDRSLGFKQRERSQYSQLANFQRINEELALGTRPTIPNPRRSQVAPMRFETEDRLLIVTGRTDSAVGRRIPTRPRP